MGATAGDLSQQDDRTTDNGGTGVTTGDTARVGPTSAATVGIPSPRSNAVPVLGIGLVLIYVLLRGIFLAQLTPPWQGPDEPGHMAYILQLARDGRMPTHPDYSLESQILSSMAANNFYRLVGAEAPEGVPKAFADVERLGTDNTQVGNETPVGYLPHAAFAAVLGAATGASPVAIPEEGAADAVRHLEDTLLRLRLINVLLSVLTIAAVAWATAEILSLALAPAAAALAAAAPMLGFGGAIVNNDLTAAALSALWFGVLGRTLHRGPTVGRVVALIGLTLLAALAKRTALYLLPLLLIVALAAMWRRTQRQRAKANQQRSRFDVTRSEIRPVRLTMGVSLVLAIILLWPQPDHPSGWRQIGRDWGPVRTAESAHFGDWGFFIEDSEAAEWQYLEQTVSGRRGGNVTAMAWLRSRNPGTRAQLVVNDDRGTWLGETVSLDEDWQLVTVTGALAPSASTVRMAIVPGDGTSEGTGALHADDLLLEWTGEGARPRSTERVLRATSEHGEPVIHTSRSILPTNELLNPGAESPRRVGSSLLAGMRRYTDADRLIGALAGAGTDPGGVVASTQRGLDFLFHSFWGGFGWLTIWPGDVYFAVAAMLTAFVLVAQAVALLRPRLAASERWAIDGLRVCAIATLLAIAISIAGLMAGASWERLPQGRYLLAALAPLTIPGVALAHRVVPRWGPLALALSAIALDLTALVLYIWPTYRGL